MKMNVFSRPISLCLIALAALTFAAQKAEAASSKSSLTLDAAIKEAASYFVQQIPVKAKVALIPFDCPTGRLSDYVFEELWSRFEDSRNFVMVDRKNLDRIETEIKIQYESGSVGEKSMVSISKQYGAEFLVYGQLSVLGKEYRMTVYATDVEKASSSQRAFIIKSDKRLASLINVSPDDEVDRAVSVMLWQKRLIKKPL
jgi:TolB-like protein